MFLVKLKGFIEDCFIFADERENGYKQIPGAFVIIRREHAAAAQGITIHRVAGTIETPPKKRVPPIK